MKKQFFKSHRNTLETGSV